MKGEGGQPVAAKLEDTYNAYKLLFSFIFMSSQQLATKGLFVRTNYYLVLVVETMPSYTF
eukprot:scaffold1904_cov184-Amphora_coffeaeformis.AAC.8